MFKGPHTAESKLKISSKHKGMLRTIEHRKNVSLSKLGKQNPQWKGDEVGGLLVFTNG